jgi:hypothetical protein
MLYKPPTASASMPPQSPVSARAESGNGKHRRYRSVRRHFESGTRRAALRALTGAELFLAGMASTMTKAAEMTGSNTIYVGAAVTILRAGDDALKAAVLDGKVSLLAAATVMRQLAELAPSR